MGLLLDDLHETLRRYVPKSDAEAFIAEFTTAKPYGDGLDASESDGDGPADGQSRQRD